MNEETMRAAKPASALLAFSKKIPICEAIPHPIEMIAAIGRLQRKILVTKRLTA
jgi:hypothetical protein